MSDDPYMELVLKCAREGAACARPGFGVDAGRGWGAIRAYTGFTPNGLQIVHEFYPIPCNYKPSEVFPAAVLNGCPFLYRGAPGWKISGTGGIEFS